MIVDPTVLKPIVNIEGQTCFGCGTSNSVGLHMEFCTDDQRVFSFVTVPGNMAGWDTTVHGGIISTILDEIMGWSVIYLLGRIGLTKTMTVSFRKPIQVEQPLTVIGAIDEVVSERQVLVSGAIHSEDGTLCAASQGTFAAMPAPTAVRLGVMRPEYMQRFLPILEQKSLR